MNGDRPLISCIIPAYNSEKTIERAVYSLIEQGLDDNLQIIIADDDSTAPFFYLVQQEFRKYKNNLYVRIPPHDKHSPGYTQRYAMRFVHGKYLMNLDHDDYLMKDSLKDILNTLEESKKNDKDISLLWTNPFWESADGTLQELSQNTTWTHGKIYDVDFIREHNINFEDWKLYQDLQFNMHFEIHMRCNHNKRLFLDNNFYIWTDEPTSITHQNFELHTKNYAEYMYRANKSTLNMYMYRYYYKQNQQDHERFLSYFIDSLRSLYSLYDSAFRTQRHYFIKRFANDIIEAFDISQQKLLSELKNIEIGKIIIDERKIIVCTDLK